MSNSSRSAATAVSFGTMDYTSGSVIAVLVVFNVGTGTINEWKAEKVGTIVFRIIPRNHLTPLRYRLSLHSRVLGAP